METTIFSGETQLPTTSCREINFNENGKQGHGNEACVMEIITVSMDLPHASYIERNVKEKIMVFKLKVHEMEN